MVNNKLCVMVISLRRNVATGVGNVKVKLPKVRDRKGSGIQFHSLLVPPYMRRAKTIDELLPLLYLQGISTNHFQEALAPILGENAKNVSPQVICRLKEQWRDELKAWQNCSLSDKRYVYWWVDGIYFNGPYGKPEDLCARDNRCDR